MIVNVVAMTARPISAVPSRAASKWSLPRCRCRTMFSRTTIASSISMPMASERPIRVSTFSVKPKTRMAMKPAMTEMGSVSPVMTVERHEFRNRKTMKTVSRPPISIVTFTSSIDSRMKVESSLMIERVTPGGSSFFSFSTASRTPSATATVLAPDCFWTSSARAGPLVEEGRVLRLLDAVDHLRDVAHETACRPTRLTGISRDLGRGRAARRHAHQGLGRAAVGGAGRHVDVLPLERVDHLGQREVVGLEPRAVDDDLDLARRLADEVHRADAAHVLEPALHDLVRERRGGLAA